MTVFRGSESQIQETVGAEGHQGSPQPAAASPADETIARSVLIPAISTMISDGEISGSEAAQVSNLCSFSPIYCDIGPGKLDAIIEQGINEVIVGGQSEAIKRAGASLSPALRETALCFAMRVALADGHINDSERNALVRTAEYLEIDSEIFEQILEVVTMMQRPAAA